jgi:hypothetical protein
MMVQIGIEVCKVRLITMLFFFSKWEITLHEALFREKALMSIFIQSIMFVLQYVTSGYKQKGFTLDNAAFYGLQSLADNPPYYYALSFDVCTNTAQSNYFFIVSNWVRNKDEKDKQCL